MAFFFNDQFLEDEQALIHASDLSMQRGYAIFDFFRVMNGAPLFMRDHIDRFYTSAKAMHLPVGKEKDELVSIIKELVKKTALSDAGIRLFLTGGYSPDGYHPAKPNLLLSCKSVKIATASDFEQGLSIITWEYQRELPQIKSINYQVAVWLQPLLKERRADDVLYIKDGIISEFPRSNIFIVTPDQRLVTPSGNVLLGITRKKVLSLAAALMPVEERDITVDEMMKADEVFLASTTKTILPVFRINDKMIGNGKQGKISTILYQKLIEFEKVSTTW